MLMTMNGMLSECILLAYRTSIESARRFLPEGLELITYQGHAFWNIVICEGKQMRLPGMPAWMGMQCRHIAFRLYVKACTQENEWIEGLYFVHSDTDQPFLWAFGNQTSDFNFHPAMIKIEDKPDRVTALLEGRLGSRSAGTLIATPEEQFSLEPDSCFESEQAAAQFLKYSPYGLSVDSHGKMLKLAEVFREEAAWKETSLQVSISEWSFFQQHQIQDITLERATRVTPISYIWRLGRRERIKKL